MPAPTRWATASRGIITGSSRGPRQHSQRLHHRPGLRWSPTPYRESRGVKSNLAGNDHRFDPPVRIQFVSSSITWSRRERQPARHLGAPIGRAIFFTWPAPVQAPSGVRQRTKALNRESRARGAPVLAERCRPPKWAQLIDVRLTPSASITSAEPDFDVGARLPLATNAHVAASTMRTWSMLTVLLSRPRRADDVGARGWAESTRCA